jgi:opacity protein-like surface antigen
LPPPVNWAGFYVGGHVGAFIDEANFSNPFGPSLFGDKVTSPGFMAGFQIGYNWVVAPRWILGIEGSGTLLDGDGTFTCLQPSTTFVGSNCRSRPRALAALTGRLGYVADTVGRTMVYGKAGAAWMRNDVSAMTNNAFTNVSTQVAIVGPRFQGPSTHANLGVWGWTIGAGVERALTPAWSLSLEYDYYRFDNGSIGTPETIDVVPTGPTTAVSTFVPADAASRIRQDLHAFRLGLNYRWGVDTAASWAEGMTVNASAIPTTAPSGTVPTAGWEIEGGVRYWYSVGRFQSDFPRTSSGALISRLTYQDMTGHSGEAFARFDSPFNVFVKGFAGAGSISSGKHFDEDWGLLGNEPTSFEVTRSDIGGSISYVTADIGFNVLRGPDHKVGLFAGYNFFHAYMGSMGCVQLVAPASGICAPAIPTSEPGTSETDDWHSLRLGVSVEARLWDRLKISGDFAYLPYVRFEGLDNHRARENLTLYPADGTGRGIQAEIILSYLVTSNLSLGLGGRYWAMWTTTAQQSCIGCNGPGSFSPPGPGKANTETFGGFVQASYVFDPIR